MRLGDLQYINALRFERTGVAATSTRSDSVSGA